MWGYNQSQNIVAQPKYAHSLFPLIPPTHCLESVKFVWNCSEGCLVHLGGIKLKKSTLKLEEGGLCHNFSE